MNFWRELWVRLCYPGCGSVRLGLRWGGVEVFEGGAVTGCLSSDLEIWFFVTGENKWVCTMLKSAHTMVWWTQFVVTPVGRHRQQDPFTVCDEHNLFVVSPVGRQRQQDPCAVVWWTQFIVSPVCTQCQQDPFTVLWWTQFVVSPVGRQCQQDPFTLVWCTQFVFPSWQKEATCWGRENYGSKGTYERKEH